MAGKYDSLIFITTEKMANKQMGQYMENALGLAPGSVTRVLISNDDYSATLKALKDKNFSNDDKYIVNITGGTKIMSLATFEFFKGFNNTSFVYVPITTNTYVETDTGETHPINYRVSLYEYLALYGLRYESSTTLLMPAADTENFFEEIKRKRFRPHKKIKEAHTFKDSRLAKYYSGEWFEEYCYNRIKKEKHLRDEDIALSMKIYRKDSVMHDNEIDVAFTLDNQLYIIECKYSMWGYGKETQKTIQDYLYKLAAICKDLGLIVNPYLLTLHPMHFLDEKALEHLEKRTKILGIRDIIAQDKFMQALLPL